jgi:hypothetical protein
MRPNFIISQLSFISNLYSYFEFQTQFQFQHLLYEFISSKRVKNKNLIKRKKSTLWNFPFPTFLDLKVLVVLGLAIFEVVKVYVWIFAHFNAPPSPHKVAQHDSQLKLRQKPLDLIFDFCLCFSIAQGLLVLCIIPALGKTVTLDKKPFQLIQVLRQLIPTKIPILIPDIEIHLKLIKIIRNVINGVIVCRVLIIDEYILVVRVLDQNVVGQQIVV